MRKNYLNRKTLTTHSELLPVEEMCRIVYLQLHLHTLEITRTSTAQTSAEVRMNDRRSDGALHRSYIHTEKNIKGTDWRIMWPESSVLISPDGDDALSGRTWLCSVKPGSTADAPLWWQNAALGYDITPPLRAWHKHWRFTAKQREEPGTTTNVE